MGSHGTTAARGPHASSLTRNARCALALTLASGAASAACSRAEAERQARQRASQVARATLEGASAARQQAGEVVGQARAYAAPVLEIKRELDAVYQRHTDYDLVVSAERADSARLRAHEAEMASLPHVQVNGVTVGYSESSERSLGGASYATHFRATWVRNGRVFGVGYYSRERIDGAAFVELLQHLAPIVERRMDASGASLARPPVRTQART